MQCPHIPSYVHFTYGRKLISIQTPDLLSDLGEIPLKRYEHNVPRICEFCESRHREDHASLRVYMNSRLCVYREVYDTEKIKKTCLQSLCAVALSTSFIILLTVAREMMIIRR
jgi:hypothetical protein